MSGVAELHQGDASKSPFPRAQTGEHPSYKTCPYRTAPAFWQLFLFLKFETLDETSLYYSILYSLLECKIVFLTMNLSLDTSFKKISVA